MPQLNITGQIDSIRQRLNPNRTDQVTDQDSTSRTWLICCALLLAGVLARVFAFNFYFEAPGDGPSRAVLAMLWAKSPQLWPHIAWLPGYIYVTGAFSWLVPDPLVSTRIFNLIIGSLTIPAFYLLVRRVFDSATALLSAVVLLAFPLHIILSVTSLTEVSVVFEVLVGMLMLLWAVDQRGSSRLAGLMLCTLMMALASLTRYEVWLLLPIFVLYYLWATHRFWQSVLFGAGLALPPAYWMILSYTNTGVFLSGYEAATLTIGDSISYASGIRAIARFLSHYLGQFLTIAALVTAAIFGALMAKRRLGSEIVFYLLTLAVISLFLVKFVHDRGGFVFPRYFLTLFVLAIPLASWPLIRLAGARARWAAWVIAALCIALPFTSQVSRIDYVVQELPKEVTVLTQWLEDNPEYDNSALLFTAMYWWPSYVPLLHPDRAFSYIIVSEWWLESDIYNFTQAHQPALLITMEGDEDHVRQIEMSIGAALPTDRKLYDQDSMLIYNISDLWNSTTPQPGLSCTTVGPGFRQACPKTPD